MNFFSSTGRKSEKVEGELQPVRLLDDLFRKTKATPCIYWLPLSDEQVSLNAFRVPFNNLIVDFISDH